MSNVFLQLAEFFQPDEVEWKPQAVSGERALAVAYINARAVMERLDEVVGPTNWRDEYMVMPEGVECRLSLRIGGEWITKVDVGDPAGSDPADRIKGGYSNALKRAAVKWGVGRYLYDLPLQWVPFDPQKKRFVKEPQLPADYVPPPATVGSVRGQELLDLCQQAGVDPKTVLDHCKVRDFNFIPKSKYAAFKQRFLRGAAEKVGG